MPFYKILDSSIYSLKLYQLMRFYILIIPKFYVRINRKAPYEKFRLI